MTLISGKAITGNSRLALVLIFLCAILLRLAPVLLYNMPINYDAPFHARSAQAIIEWQALSLYDESPAGEESRPNNYPPFYHLFLAELSLLSGISVFSLGMIVLPIFSALICISAYLLASNLFGRGKALLAAILFAVVPVLVVNSYDSPENILFFILPLILLLAMHSKKLSSALLYGSLIFWNYLAFIFTLPAILIAFRKDKKLLPFLMLSTAFFVSLNLFLRGPSFLDNKSLEVGMDFVAYNLRSYLLSITIFSFLFGAAVLFLFFRSREKAYDSDEGATKSPNRETLLFFAAWCFLSSLAAISVLFTNLARPWEMPKFVAYSSFFLIPVFLEKKHFAFMCALSMAFLAFSLVFSSQVLFPRITREDFSAIRFLENNFTGEGRILAESSLSEYLRITAPSLSPFLLTTLYYENLARESSTGKALRFLMLGKNSDDSEKFFQDSNASFLLLNYEDFAARESLVFNEKKYFDKTYSLIYCIPCPFPFLGKETSFACGCNQTELLRKNYLAGIFQTSK